jgi:ABC-type dipeptide/oligopeptide/nickel transport system permease subunit
MKRVVSGTLAQGAAVRPTARRAPSKHHWPPMLGIGLAIFGLIALAAAFAPVLTPYDPTTQALLDRLQAPSWSHPLGTDEYGRDVLARLLYGGRFSLSIALSTTLIVGVLGTLIGIVSGWYGGLIDEVLMRLVDLLIAFPSIAVALVIAALLPTSAATLVLALAIAGWTPYARLARALVLDIRTRAFIEAAVAIGASGSAILWRQVVPNMLGPILATAFLRFGHTLLLIAGLSYLGLGAQPPTPDWGVMLADAQPYMQRIPSLILAPGLTIFFAALSVTLIGQGLLLMFDAHHKRAR